MAEWAFRRLSTLMRPRFCVSVDRRTCVDQSRHLAQEAVLRVHIVRLEERASEHHFQEIVTLFALNGGMLSSKLSMNVMCPVGWAAESSSGSTSLQLRRQNGLHVK